MIEKGETMNPLSMLILKLYCEFGCSEFPVFKNKPLEADKAEKEQWEKWLLGEYI